MGSILLRFWLLRLILTIFCLDILIKMTADGYRGGARIGSTDLIHLLDATGAVLNINCRGLMVYPGCVTRTKTVSERANFSESHLQAEETRASALRLAGLSKEVRTFGLIAVMMAADRLGGMTEHRGGNYVFKDLREVQMGGSLVMRLHSL